jgi:hypothetical protein
MRVLESLEDDKIIEKNISALQHRSAMILLMGLLNQDL